MENTDSQMEMKIKDELLESFNYDHLPPDLQIISRQFHNVAYSMNSLLPLCYQKILTMQKLLEAKDCAVRARLQLTKGERE